MGPVQRLIVKTAMRSVRHPKLTLAVALVILGVSVIVAVGWLKISSNENELFSEKEAYFRDYQKFTDQFPENEAIYIAIQKRDPKARVSLDRWSEAAELVAAKLKPMTEYVENVEYRAPGSVMGEWGLIFDEPKSVKTERAEVDEFAKLIKVVAEKPTFIDMLGIGNAPAERFFRAMDHGDKKDQAESAGLIAEAARSAGLTLAAGKVVPPDLAHVPNSPRDMGYFYEPDQLDKGKPDAEVRHLLLIRVYHKHNYSSLTAITTTVDAIRDAAKGTITDKTFPEFTIALTGRPVLEADEMRVSEHDTRISEIIACIAVFLGMILFFMPWSEVRRSPTLRVGFVTFLRGLWLALVAEITLAIAIGSTFGWAALSVGRLNLLSLVFVIALIGIGMDYLIQFVSRYRREAQRYERPTAIWARVFRYASPPVSTACMGAAGAFFVSAFTPFRGAAELGIIAGGGLLLCLISGYTVLPAILTLFPPGIKHKHGKERFGDGVQRGGGWRLLIPAAWLGLTVALVPQMLKVSFDPNLLNLQASHLEGVQMVRHLESWYAVAVSDNLDTLRNVRNIAASDGAISKADLAHDEVTINVGKANHLEPGVSFYVYDPRTGANVFTGDFSKGTIEVVEAGEHESRCRITRRENGQTIAADDVIYHVDNRGAISQVDRTDSMVERQDNDGFLKSTVAKLPKIKWATPAPMNTLGVNELDKALQSLEKKMHALNTFEGDEAEGRLKAAIAALSGTDKEKAATILTQWQDALLKEFREGHAQFSPSPVMMEKIPIEVRQHYVLLPEAGSSAKPLYALYIYPKKDLWLQANLVEFVNEIEGKTAKLKTGAYSDKGDTRNFVLTGLAPEILHTTAEIQHSFYMATIYAVCLIFVLVLLDMRSILHTLLAMSVLVLGLLMLMGVMGVLAQIFKDKSYLMEFNLANFFALPILIGAGHEYGVFMVHRYKETLHNPRRVWQGWDVSDRALLLCGYVTSMSFAFLVIVGEHHGMQSLGFVMAVGTGCIYLATICVLRPLLVWRLKRKANQPADAEQTIIAKP